MKSTTNPLYTYETIIFTHSKHWVSRAIKIITGCKWTHVGIVDGDYILESRGGKGVVRTPMKSFLRHYNDDILFRKLPIDMELARSKIGCGFDEKGMFAVLFRANWQDPDLYFCSEYVAEVTDRFDTEFAHLITPKHILWASLPAEYSL
jgi:hypothetical protein